MASLPVDPRIEDIDELYAELIDAHRGLTAEQSQALNARLILLLIQQVGNGDVVREALQVAKAAHGSSGTTPLS